MCRHPLFICMALINGLLFLMFFFFILQLLLFKLLADTESFLAGAMHKEFGNKSHSQTQVLGTKQLLLASCVDSKLFSFNQIWDSGTKHKPGSPCSSKTTILSMLALSNMSAQVPYGNCYPGFL